MLQNQRAGAPVEWTIGRAGQSVDTWAARLGEEPHFGMDDRGNPGIVATIITAQKNLDGEEFLGERTVQVRYLFDRTYAVEALDGTKDRPKSLANLIADRQQSVKDFLATRGQSVSVENLVAEIAAESPSAG